MHLANRYPWFQIEPGKAEQRNAKRKACKYIFKYYPYHTMYQLKKHLLIDGGIITNLCSELAILYQYPVL